MSSKLWRPWGRFLFIYVKAQTELLFFRFLLSKSSSHDRSVTELDKYAGELNFVMIVFEAILDAVKENESQGLGKQL